MTVGVRLALVDDDEDVLDALCLFFDVKGLDVYRFNDGNSLLGAVCTGSVFDCIVSDVRMPGIDGVALYKELRKLPSPAPIILITGHGEIDLAVQAIKDGVHDFIQKPFDEQRLLSAIESAVEQSSQSALHASDLGELRDRVARLSERQRQVMELAAQGLTNKEIAVQMNIGTRTVESYRAWVMERLDARNLADLIKIAMRLGLVK